MEADVGDAMSTILRLSANTSKLVDALLKHYFNQQVHARSIVVLG